jgi:antitoxin HicB
LCPFHHGLVHEGGWSVERDEEGRFSFVAPTGKSVRTDVVGRAKATGAPDGVSCYRFFVRFRVLIEQDEDGVFVATCPSLPGCVSQGRTRAEAAASIRDAVEGYVASLKKHGEPIPPSIDEDVVEVAV